MDFNLYAAERIMEDRLAELRRRSARLALLRAVQPAPRLSRRLGAGLIRVGHWLVREDAVRVRNAGVRVAR